MEDLTALLRIPTVAAWAGESMEAGAQWLAARLSRAGLAAQILAGPRGSAPYVYAETEQRGDRPTLLIYGHYDVQPARREDGWASDPFIPELRDGRLYARGTMDQKMNLLLPLFALEMMGGACGFNIKFFLEGEEEIFSPHLADALQLYGDLLTSDVCFSSDGWQAGPQTGDLRLGLRGFCGLEISLQGAEKELHSGTFGGVAPNPAAALVLLLSGLWTPSGKIAVPGFLDGVAAPSPAEVALASEGFDAAAWRQRAGLSPNQKLAVPEAEIPVALGLRPALEINALDAGGYAGGFRSVVPSRASARVSARLVPGQQPNAILAKLDDWLRENAPQGYDIRIETMPGTAQPYRLSADDPMQRLAAQVLTEVDGRAPRFTYSGGSIPLFGQIDELLGIKTIIFGFGLPDGNMHGVDEFIRLSDIRRGLAAWRALLSHPTLPR
ncbi:M20/M25/M40 family metallo-hydrolase [Maritimibacter alkaliphilus]|uniref:M20/M25/M40 family metallo-hydrolase n=1 Tax=Maritimibacter alkaliphilus TaxID=404236 RepID=UPI001C942B4C|nr:M20/M25/M40 family metallo-hydrolase [Maritimibacter alkaliphilus]MBY6090478.1 M20/M25/M40 family metallo-hydrolase [Maritimibacter alkaliphilus]